jgi:hypothetical protein
VVGDRCAKVAVALLSLWAATLVAPPAAPALGGPETGGYGAFRLKASNGYEVFVLAASRAGYRKGEARIFVSRRDRAVFYDAPATVTDTRIAVDLGAVGRIDVEFEPSGSTGVARSSCEPDYRVAYEKGSYVGTVDFRGEEGYSEVTATRVPISIQPFVEVGCFTIGEGETFGDGIEGARLRVLTRLPRGRLSLQANQNRPGARVRLRTSIEEQRGAIRVFRVIGAVYPADALQFDPKLRSAVLRPPAPFSGSGIFRRGAKQANRWTGSLTVDFPGRSNVSLTGDRFHVGLLHATYMRETLQSRHRRRPTLSSWPSTKLSPTASATSSPPAPS